MTEALAPEGFIDLHSHVLPGVDDGAETLAEAVGLVRSLCDLGFTCVVATPHVRPGLYDPEPAVVMAALRKLRAALAPGGPRLLVAGEHFLDDEVWVRIADGRARPFPNGRSILVEISTVGPAPPRLSEQMFWLRVSGLQPVLAHPERCQAFQENVELVRELRRSGAATALDLMSLVGHGGRESRKAAERFLDLGLFDAACTDLHGEWELGDLVKSIERLRRLVGDDGLDCLLHRGPLRLALDLPTAPAEHH